MRLHGWCEKCHKIKLVTVRPWSLQHGGVMIGVCSECEDRSRTREGERPLS